ncbi:MAG: PP0621 family protein [Rubrivivax sp.]
MGKILVLLLVVGVAVWALLTRSRGPRRDPGVRGPGAPRGGAAPAPGAAGGAQDMLRCAHCGVHLPAPEAVHALGRGYCSAEHAAAGPREG